MKRQNTTKRGAASLFVVVITIILLGVITLGFTRLILNEANQTTNNDLSQSAYDSALAGIEDAKIALLRYHSCLSQGYKADQYAAADTCSYLIYSMQNDIAHNSCDTVAHALGREPNTEDGSDGEVIIQETQSSNSAGNAEYMSQAYTCVTIKEDLEDYRTTMNDSNRVRIVPLRTSSVRDIDSIDVEWYSDANNTSNKFSQNVSVYDSQLPQNNERVENTAPLLSVQFYQTNEIFKLSELSYSSTSGTDLGTLYLRPSSSGTTSIPANTLIKSADKSVQNEPIDTHCEVRSPFYCKTNIELPSPFAGGVRAEGTAFLILGLPYGTPETDISITLRREDESILSFTGVQAKVDSTGRANDLYRRVESRVELVDTYFPYPEYEIQMTGDNSDIEKSFWITNNCWTSNNGNRSSCSQNGSIASSL